MSVLVKGMEMPNNCRECEIGLVYPCYSEQHLCPLIEVPAQHGRLIDADKLLASFKESIDECHKWANEVPNDTMFYARVSQALGTFVECALRTKGMPTVIPAEITTKDPPTGTFKGDELFVFKEEGSE